MISVPEVHDHERDVAHDIDPAQIGVELDAIEDPNRGAFDEGVAQMQVAVALAHEPVALPRPETRLESAAAPLGPLGKRREARLIGGVGEQSRNLFKVLTCGQDDTFGRAKRAPAGALSQAW